MYLTLGRGTLEVIVEDISFVWIITISHDRIMYSVFTNANVNDSLAWRAFWKGVMIENFNQRSLSEKWSIKETVRWTTSKILFKSAKIKGKPTIKFPHCKRFLPIHSILILYSNWVLKERSYGFKTQFHKLCASCFRFYWHEH